MIEKLSILYIGSLNTNSNSHRRFIALTEIYDTVHAIDTDPYILPKYISGFQHHLNFGPGIYVLNKKIKLQIKKITYDIIVVDNKPYLTAGTLKYIKTNGASNKIVNVLTDDPFGKFTRSWGLLKKTARHYDIIFVQRKVNVEELKKVGAKRVELCYRSFDPKYNRPLQLDEKDYTKYHCSVGFVGAYENIRASYIAYLIQNQIPVKVTGDGWPNKDFWEIIKPCYIGPSVYGDNYIKTLNGMDIALHFLRHANRDEQDSRTFEIPACRIFMLAEYSELHNNLFKNGEEAIFFNSKEDLLQKVRLYLSNKVERDRIALNGYNRCYEKGYDHQSRMKAIFKTLMFDEEV